MANREQSAEELFGAALELALEDRATFLDESCRGASELRRHVEELLHDNDRLGSFLAQPLFTPDGVSTACDLTTSASSASSSRFQPKQRIADRFLVVRFIARGGMGEVYEVKDQFLQDANVALKIIRPEIAADVSNSRRFEQEVILARKVAPSQPMPDLRDISLRAAWASLSVPHDETTQRRDARYSPQTVQESSRR